MSEILIAVILFVQLVLRVNCIIILYKLCYHIILKLFVILIDDCMYFVIECIFENFNCNLSNQVLPVCRNDCASE